MSEVALDGERLDARRSQPARTLGVLLRRSRLVLCGLSGAAEADVRRLAVMSVLAGGEASSQQRLARYLSINPSVMVGLIDELERNGFVERRRRESDRRSYAVTLSEAGRREAAVLGVRLDRVFDLLLSPLDEAAVRRLVALLSRLVSPHYEPPLPPVLACSPAFLVTAAAEQLEAQCDALLKPLDASVRTFVALAVVGGMACSQASLASTLFLSPAATVDLVDTLESKGLVRRARPPSDRRRYSLELTARGQELLAGCHPALTKATAGYTSQLDTAENRELLALLEALDRPPVKHS